jgi:hypothetical protein
LSDDQKAMVAESIRERRSKLYRGDQAKEARAGVQARHPLKRDVSVNVSETSGPALHAESVNVSDPPKPQVPKRDTRAKVVREVRARYNTA